MGDLPLNYVDKPIVTIAPKDTWVNLSFDELIKTKNVLYDRMLMAKRNPAYVKPLEQGIAELDQLISMKIGAKA